MSPMPKFSPEDAALLAPYVSSTDEDVFAVKNLPGITGAVYARYSRAQGGFRETLLKEFLKTGKIDAARAQDLIERVLIAFGDDSVGELEGAHVSFERISILATKEIEDRRIGGSPIEQSTRYVFYDQKDAEGNYRYYRDPAILASVHGQAYLETMDFIFATYCKLVEPMQQYYRGLKPVEAAEYDINGDGVKEKLADLKAEADIKAFNLTYKSDIRTKACDALRALLPIATLTNVGVFGNGRFFQGAISHCYASPLPEVRDIGAKCFAALGEVIPKYVKRAHASAYLMETRQKMAALAERLFAGIAPAQEVSVALADRGAAAIAKRIHELRVLNEPNVETVLQEEEDHLLISLALYPYLQHPLQQIREVVRGLEAATKREILATYVGDRRTRRDRPGRAFEAGYPHTFDMLTDFGTYKDLQRHRMTSQQRQKFTPALGFDMPADLEAAGFAAEALECDRRARELYARLLPDFPEAASYATLHGSRVRWTIAMNDREAMHLIELRTTPQGHASYRQVGQLMHQAIEARSPWRAAAMKFADHNAYESARGDSEARQRVKEAALETAAKPSDNK